MKRIFFFASAVLAVSQSAFATIAFSDDFNSYTNGNLAGTSQNAFGQGTWQQNNTSSATPIQINNGAVVLGTSGQDIYSALSTPITLTDGSSFYIGLDVNVASAQTAGDYFLHWSTPAGSTSTFQERLFVKSSGIGYVLGYATTAGGTTAYGSSVLDFNTSYQLVLSYNAVTGPLNDTFSLYVNPTDLSVEGNNTAYLSSGYVGTGAEQSTVSAINFRQGSGANSASLTADNLVVGTTFAEASAGVVPEPSTFALILGGGFAALMALRRKS